MIDRRHVLLGAAGAVAGLALPATAATAAPAGFPNYQYIGTPFNKANLRYNPTGELIFPCIRGVYDKISSPLGRYYLYYAPHDAPGGICLAYGNSLGGQFTEYPANPIVPNVWSPHYSVSHVSSPHVIWDTATSKFFMYFHGENTTTRMAWSTDGVHYTYFGTVLTTANIPGTSEVSYARVFEHQITGKSNKYVMLFMGNQGGTRRIFYGWSSDGKSWQYSTTPLLWPSDDGQAQISAPHLLKRNNSCYVVYHGDSGDMYITEVGNGFNLSNHLGVFHSALSGGPDNGRSAAPSFGSDGGVQYMFYEAGQRSSSTIAVARAV
jgi:hypothetical protein